MSVFAVVEKNIATLISEEPRLFDGFNTPESKLGMAFMVYSLNNIFKNCESDAIEEGIVDSLYRAEKHDFGIDAFYLTANSEIISSIDELSGYNNDTKFAFHFLQFKKGRGIDLSDLLKLKEGITKVVIDESFDSTQNIYMYSRMELINTIKQYLYTNYSSDQIAIKIYVVFNGLEDNVLKNDLLSAQIKDINNDLIENGYNNPQFEVIGAQTNLRLSKNTEEIIGVIKYQKTFKYITEEDKDKKLNGYVSVIKAIEIAQLVKKHQDELFEANIRDYYRRNDLNSKIIDTSANPDESKYFWSYNNGLTITCGRVEELPNDTYRLHGIQIVNGCQTSNALYSAYTNLEIYNTLTNKRANGSKLNKKEQIQLENSSKRMLNENTNVLVKIVETNDADLIYRITETTNSQTPIKTFSLKANDNIQQNIEQYLGQEGIYYERRVNYYKNKGKKPIISIQQLFQLYTSQILFKPSLAKNALKVTFSNLYEKVFPSVESGKSFDYKTYLIPILVDQKIDEYSRLYSKTTPGIDTYNKVLLSYGRLHLAPLVLSAILGPYNAKSIIQNFDIIKLTLNDNKNFERIFIRALFELKQLVQGISGQRPESIGTAIRRTDLDDRISRLINAKRMPAINSALITPQ